MRLRGKEKSEVKWPFRRGIRRPPKSGLCKKELARVGVPKKAFLKADAVS